MSDEITKQDSLRSFSLSRGKLTAKRSALQERIAAQQSAVAAADQMPNRICLMLDCSSSMSETVEQAGLRSKTKLDLLKEAVENFASRCDFSNSSVSIETFPERSERASLPLSVGTVVLFHAQSFEARGGTPLHACVERAINKVPMTRAVIVSDGEAWDWFVEDVKGDAVLKLYKDRQIAIDCVHIGDSSSREELLRRIAHETNGLYLKFTDVGAFASAFGYLTPGFRAMLTSGTLDAAKLGASEIKR